MKPLDPVTVPTDASGNPQPFSISLPTENRPVAVKLSNQSPWVQTVRMSGFADYLDTYTADVYPVPHDAFEIDFTPRAIIAGAPTKLSAVILPVLAYTGERFAGTYPMALPRQSATYQQLLPMVVNVGDSGIYTTPANTVLTNVVYPILPGTQSVRWEINQLNVNAKWTGNTLVGNVTGRRYNTGTANPGGFGGFDEVFQLEPEDTALLLSIDTTGSANPVTYWLTANMAAGFVAARLSGQGTASGNPIWVRDDQPQPWQTFPLSKRIDIIANGGDQAVGIGDGVNILRLGPATLFSGVAVRIAFKDGNGGTTRWVQPLEASVAKPIGWNGLKLAATNDLFVNAGNGTEIEFSVSYSLASF